MAKIGTISLQGCSGKLYEFNIYEFGTNFNSLGAVYFISKRHDENHTTIYLGITDDLSTRFNNHHKKECIIKYGANCISVLQNASEVERKSIEEDILCYYDFPCNDVKN